MSANRRYPSLVGPIIVIGLGILLLMSNLGMLEWSVWDAILKLWPLLLVAAGLDLLIGRRSPLGNLLVAIVMIAMLAGGIWWLDQSRIAGLPLPDNNVSQSLDGARSAEVDIKAGATSLRITGGAAADRLVTGVLSADAGAQVVGDARVENDVLKYTLRTQVGRVTGFPWTGERRSSLSLNSQVPMVLRVSLGAGEATLDLRGVKVTAVEVETGAGKATITLPAGSIRVRVNTAVGEAVVRIPKGSAVRVNARSALGMTKAPDGGQRFGQSTYTSAAYGAAADRLDVEITSAIGMVTVEEY